MLKLEINPFRVWTQPTVEPDDGFAFYKISFQWYSVIGTIMFWIPAVIISHLTGGQDLNKFNIKLLSPFIQRMLPLKYRHTELGTIEKRISNLEREANGNALRQELTDLIRKNNTKLTT